MTLSFKIINKDLSDYLNVKTLYKQSFPKEECIPFLLLQTFADWHFFEALAFYEEEKFCGFAYCIVRKSAVWLMYLAVNENMRSRGIGTAFLDYVKKQYPDRPILLDTEIQDEKAENAAQRKRRLAFYKRNGFYETGQYYTIRKVKYEILSTKQALGKEELDRFHKDFFRRKN